MAPIHNNKQFKVFKILSMSLKAGQSKEIPMLESVVKQFCFPLDSYPTTLPTFSICAITHGQRHFKKAEDT